MEALESHEDIISAAVNMLDWGRHITRQQLKVIGKYTGSDDGLRDRTIHCRC